MVVAVDGHKWLLRKQDQRVLDWESEAGEILFSKRVDEDLDDPIQWESENVSPLKGERHILIAIVGIMGIQNGNLDCRWFHRFPH